MDITMREYKDSAWRELYPKTVAGQVVTDSSKRFVSDGQIEGWNDGIQVFGGSGVASAATVESSGEYHYSFSIPIAANAKRVEGALWTPYPINPYDGLFGILEFKLFPGSTPDIFRINSKNSGVWDSHQLDMIGLSPQVLTYEGEDWPKFWPNLDTSYGAGSGSIIGMRLENNNIMFETWERAGTPKTLRVNYWWSAVV